MRSRMKAIEDSINNPLKTQENVLFNNIYKSKNTIYGREFGFSEIKSLQQFNERVPSVFYEDFEPYIELARKGEKDVTWPGKIKWFAKSSGTTNAKSKFIPISQESLEDCHYAAGKTMFALYLNAVPETEYKTNKELLIKEMDFIAPELIKGEDCDARSDIYSLGKIMEFINYSKQH